MKFTLSLLLFSLLIVSCDNELDIIEARKDIPVVYGFISLSDTAQYIRLEKAFVDETTSALVIAQDPDSLYYDDATVELVRTSNGASFALEMVDGKLEGYSREEGAFAQSPNYLYKIRTADIALEGDQEYTLRISRESKAESLNDNFASEFGENVGAVSREDQDQGAIHRGRGVRPDLDDFLQ